MIFDEFPIPLTFYDDKSKQNKFKENAGNADVFNLWAVNNSILPFQFRNILGTVLISLQVFSDNDVLTASLKPAMLLSDTVSGFQYFTWLGDEPFAMLNGDLLNLACGKYYLKATFSDLNPFYSEEFTVMKNPDEFFIIEWTSSVGDIDPVYYGSGYKNRLYSDTFITKGVPTVEVDTEKDGFGNTVVLSRRMINNYDFSLLLAPEAIVQAVNFMALHDTVLINTKQSVRSGLIENITIDQDQIGNLALWEVTVKFNQPQFYFSGSCPTPISPPKDEEIIINTGSPAQSFDLIYDAN